MELKSAPRSVSPKLISSSISSSHDGDSWTSREQFRARRDRGKRPGLGKSLEFHLGAKFHFPATFPERRRVSYGPSSSRVGWGEQRGCHSHPPLFHGDGTRDPPHPQTQSQQHPASQWARQDLPRRGGGGTQTSAVHPGAASCSLRLLFEDMKKETTKAWLMGGHEARGNGTELLAARAGRNFPDELGQCSEQEGP